MKTAYQGVSGAFSEAAVWKLVGGDVSLLPCKNLEEVFQAVAAKKVSFGVVPVENSLAGSVVLAYDLLREYNLRIIGETVLRIEHAVIASPNTTLDSVRQIFSHPVALAQCRKFFRSHPEIEPVPDFDTAGAVDKVIRQRSTDSAAIAGPRAAKIYGGIVLADNVQDDPRNFTRFLLISRGNRALHSGRWWKTTLVFRLGNTPGSLFQALRSFAEYGINLTKVESRPIMGSGNFSYVFYLDLVVKEEDRNLVVKAIRALRKVTMSRPRVRVLGKYPINNS